MPTDKPLKRLKELEAKSKSELGNMSSSDVDPLEVPSRTSSCTQQLRSGPIVYFLFFRQRFV